MISDFSFVTEFDRYSLGRVLLFGNSSIVSDTHSGAILGMYGLRHLYCFISGRTYHPSCLWGSHVPLL